VTEEGDAVDREAVWRSALSVSSMMLGSESSREREQKSVMLSKHHVVSFLAKNRSHPKPTTLS